MTDHKQTTETIDLNDLDTFDWSKMKRQTSQQPQQQQQQQQQQMTVQQQQQTIMHQQQQQQQYTQQRTERQVTRQQITSQQRGQFGDAFLIANVPQTDEKNRPTFESSERI